MTDLRGTNGPIHVEEKATPLADAFIKAANELGFNQVDYNGGNQEGNYSAKYILHIPCTYR